MGPGKASTIRPTPDALREQAFAVLGPRMKGAVLLDLFAGTGIISMEALSRGASRTFAVERSPEAAKLVRSNLALLEGAADRCRLVVAEVLVALNVLSGSGVRCDLGWCDPPFATWEEGARALERARTLGILVPGALVVIEIPTPRSPIPTGFILERNLRGANLVRNVM
jgi:16S rRNA (guanine966-N2)-methyltransferase